MGQGGIGGVECGVRQEWGQADTGQVGCRAKKRWDKARMVQGEGWAQVATKRGWDEARMGIG